MKEGKGGKGGKGYDNYNHAVILYGSSSTGESTSCMGDYFFTTSFAYVIPFSTDSVDDLVVTYWEGSDNGGVCEFDTTGAGTTLKEGEQLIAANDGGSACGMRVSYQWNGFDGVFVQINSNNAI